MIQVPFNQAFEEWRAMARQLLARRVPPSGVDWVDSGNGGGLFEAEPVDPDPRLPVGKGTGMVPAGFLDLARMVWAHPDERRAAVLYRMLWRLTAGGEKQLLAMAVDPDVHLAEMWRKAVRRDIHKMHAFVRFRLVDVDEAAAREQFVAWYEPSTRCVRLAAPFFMKRFAGMNWSILTPDECVHWNGEELFYTDGVAGNNFAGKDGLDDLWRTYYRSIFNPARLKVKAMKSEMPVKFWKNLPEAAVIPDLIAGSGNRVDRMLETDGRAVLPPPSNAYIRNLHGRHDVEPLSEVPPEAGTLSLQELAGAVGICRACPLWEKATQAVPGTGPEGARVMIVGEQPGDREDLSGKPFVGPAGQVLRHAMALAGLDEETVYLTNAVKHFKWAPDGRRRKHVSPGREEVQHCRPWIMAERDRLQPEVIVMLGATAALSLLGREVKITRERGLLEVPGLAKRVILTYHPSYLLRLPAGPKRDKAQQDFEADLRLAC